VYLKKKSPPNWYIPVTTTTTTTTTTTNERRSTIDHAVEYIFKETKNTKTNIRKC
jgi:hypothetical protein